jgi:hypothetical protein
VNDYDPNDNRYFFAADSASPPIAPRTDRRYH